MVRIKAFIGLAFIFIIGVFVLGFVFIREKDKLNRKIQDQQDLINSQVHMIIDLKNNCDCEWLYDFYLEHAEEVGAYE
jgi:hypothetical protein